MTVNGEVHYMKFVDKLPQLVNLIIGRSMLERSTKSYNYLGEQIGEAVRSFVVQPISPPYANLEMAERYVDRVYLPHIMAALTSAYERLQSSGIETKEIKTMMVKLVEAVEKVPNAGPCLMRWSFLW
ncbi:MAG: hypothetical protein Q9198_000176 [Flavoplaca austrocitrina]